METEKRKLRFEALSRICLNNWHYIDRRILSFHEGINFFTGHSGSGKSTVIDALQILLYADTDGRSFFNKAAADDSDRYLIEYLRGMVTIGEDNAYSYLRNHNFSTTIVMELRQTDTGECQCIGVAFDVDTASNAVDGRMFFWHRGPFFDSGYRTGNRAMAIDEIKQWLQQNYTGDSYYIGPSNERFRTQMYDVYLGGLNEERFPQLFRRAIPFRMKIKLEEFVKEYICMEEDIQIEDMQESVLQYGRMRKKIGDTCQEIKALDHIGQAYELVMEQEAKKREYAYFKNSMELRSMKEQVEELQTKITEYGKDCLEQEQNKERLEVEIRNLEEVIRELDRQIAGSGCEELEEQLRALGELIERLCASKGKWQQTLSGLKRWEEQDETPNPVLWDIERFEAGDIGRQELARLKTAFEELRKDAEKSRRELDAEIRQISRQVSQLEEDLKKLRQGDKAYPRELEDARRQVLRGLSDRYQRQIPVEILADLLEVPNEGWQNAVEGYMGNRKLLLVVEPKYAKAAMEIYQTLDPKVYHRVSVLDTERVAAGEHPVKPGALAEEVVCGRPYLRAYLDYLMGNVIKCETIDELRLQRTGITGGCELYQGFQLQHINPDNYTRYAYIGKEGRQKRIRQLEKELGQLKDKLEPLRKEQEEWGRLLELEYLSYPVEEYAGWQQDMVSLPGRRQEHSRLAKKLLVLKEQDVDRWRKEQQVSELSLMGKKRERDRLIEDMADTRRTADDNRRRHLETSEKLLEAEARFVKNQDLEEKVQTYLEETGKRRNNNFETLRIHFLGKETGAEGELEERWSRLRTVRYQYLKDYPNRGFSLESKDNTEYENLSKRLKYADLEGFYEKADQQAKEAVNLFKQDFVFKIRDAIRSAMARKDELNAIIDTQDFGKDSYRFRFTKNKGPDGKYYDMFMAEDLEINPSTLRRSMENQMDMFTMNHENKYGDMINELIGIFIPPDNASQEELLEAKHNIDKYADYRTYLSFEMEQIIKGENTMMIPLSKMIKKNSGGEGQNPLYVALLASFAQAYRINLSGRRERNPTIRLVVLDEAFSKMDAEKVGSCIKLIRGFGFQAIISATNDKIQNYLESVDKTFVFANPNKKRISIQEFEKEEFLQLSGWEAEDETD